MKFSNIEELWSGVQHLDNLKTIDLWGSKHLIRCPDFSGTPNLESLRLGLAASVKRRSHHQVYEGAPLSVLMCYPGNEIPECFNI
ncbi:hypothetical protein Q3G72_007643 [Acer saccharum]|nr:hypothetical protein Q3G72_007643 [Acer saccharum]